jgi:hypothetical protein
MMIESRLHLLAFSCLVGLLLGPIGGVVYAEGETPANPSQPPTVLEPLSEGVSGLVETVHTDPDWIMVTSDVILRETLCEPWGWYDRVLNPCYQYYLESTEFSPLISPLAFRSAWRVLSVRYPGRSIDRSVF